MSTVKKICPKCGGITSFNTDADAAICEKCNAPFITDQAIEIQDDDNKLVDAKCTNCGAALKVDPNQDAAICEYCGSAFIVEKAIKNYNITINNITNNNIVADVVNIENHNYGPAIVNEISKAYRIEKEITQDQFKRDVLLNLAQDIKAPEDIDNIQITNVEEGTIEAIRGYGQVNLTYSATVGFDREEKYQETTEVWDKDSQKMVQKTETKTRTVTDWHPHSGQRIDNANDFEQLDDKYGYVGVGSALYWIPEKNITEIDVKTLKKKRVADEVISKIKDGCVSSASYSAERDLLGDHVKNYNASGTCDLLELAYYTFPYYLMTYKYKEKEYKIGTIPSGKPRFNKDDTPKGTEVNIEKQAKEETKKYATIETTMWVLFAIISALTLILGISLKAYWIGFFVVIPLVLASVYMKTKIEKYNDIVVNSFKHKLSIRKENLQKALRDNQLDELTSKEESLFSVQDNKSIQDEVSNKQLDKDKWKTATTICTIIGALMYIIAIWGTAAN